MSAADTPASPRRVKRRGLSAIGPAFITAALVFGPGSVTTNSSLGATYAYDLLWCPSSPPC